MKRTVSFTIGIVIFAAASAIGTSDEPFTHNKVLTEEAQAFGQLSVENLTAEQRAVLQAKFRNWQSSGSVAPKAPI